ncbi:hypothetical protein BJY00DRAFT_309106 [Aspergillus carlsbadensis]|nr:hypothetical protein BJY00DRAFT_309106 [Aspergillus carlsbadensis]
MPNPSDLPLELFSQVLSLAHVPSDHLQLCRLALVSRAWAFAVTPHIYKSWVYNGARHSFKRLWLFLRTIISNPNLACLVRTVHIGNWGLNPYTLLNIESLPYACLEKEFDCPLDDTSTALVHRAISQAGLAHIELDMLRAIQQADRRALMALLLASLPSLTVIRAHIPLSDPYLAIILRRSLENPDCGKPGYLDQLRKLYVFAEVPGPDVYYEMGNSGTPKAPLRLDYIWPLLFLKSLRKLSLYDLDTDGIAALVENNQRHRTCQVDNLTLTTYYDSRCESCDIQAMLTLPDSLSSLSLSIHDPNGWERGSSLLKVP